MEEFVGTLISVVLMNFRLYFSALVTQIVANRVIMLVVARKKRAKIYLYSIFGPIIRSFSRRQARLIIEDILIRRKKKVLAIAQTRNATSVFTANALSVVAVTSRGFIRLYIYRVPVYEPTSIRISLANAYDFVKRKTLHCRQLESFSDVLT